MVKLRETLRRGTRHFEKQVMMATHPAQQATAPGSAQSTPRPPRTFVSRLKALGPGMVLAVTSVGAGDMVTTLNGSSTYGMALVWTIVLGVVLKFAITEAVGRLQLSSGRTMLAQMSDIAGPVLPVVFMLFMVVIGLFYGAGLSTVTAIAITELIPGAPMVPVTIAIAVAAGAMVAFGRYTLFERIMVSLGVIMFVTVIISAIMVAADVESPEVTFATVVPQLPSGSFLAVLALIGGVGGAAGILAYGYWVREKRWQGREWLSHLRYDAATSYVGVLVFAVAMSVLGTALIYGTGESIAGNAGLAAIAGPIAGIAGEIGRIIFLLCLVAVVFSSILGGFSAMGYIVADAIRVLRKIPDEEADAHMSSSTPVFRGMILYCVLCAILFQFADRPVTMVIIYATLSAFILPVLSGSLLVLLNRRDIAPGFRNGLVSNCVLVLGLVLFVILCISQVVEVLSGLN
jgi:Mn2+/Fe2+ NRAMP family transporter